MHPNYMDLILRFFIGQRWCLCKSRDPRCRLLFVVRVGAIGLAAR